MVAQERGHLALGFHGDAVVGGVAFDDGVLAQLARAVRQLHADRRVLARARRGEVTLQGVGVDGVAELGFLRDGGGAEHVACLHAVRFVELAFVLDQDVGHQPVHLVPGLGDFWGDGVTKHLDDGGHQVVVHDLVLVRRDAQRDVLVRDAVQHHHWVRRVGIHQLRGERRHRRRQRLLLRALLLVAAVERVGDELGVGGEHLVVEGLRDRLDVRAYRRERRLDDLGVLVAQVGLFRVRFLVNEHKHEYTRVY